MDPRHPDASITHTVLEIGMKLAGAIDMYFLFKRTKEEKKKKRTQSLERNDAHTYTVIENRDWWMSLCVDV